MPRRTRAQREHDERVAQAGAVLQMVLQVAILTAQHLQSVSAASTTSSSSSPAAGKGKGHGRGRAGQGRGRGRGHGGYPFGGRGAWQVDGAAALLDQEQILPLTNGDGEQSDISPEDTHPKDGGDKTKDGH